MPLTLLRHTRPAVGPEICYGARDVALAETFEAEAAALLPGLPPVDRIVTSPLARCARLAEWLGDRLDVPVTQDPDWREIDFGRWEGLAWDAVPRDELGLWCEDFMAARPHGGESVAMLLARVRTAAARFCPEDRALAVTHGGPIRAALFAAGSDPEAWTRTVPFGTLVPLPSRPRRAAAVAS